MSSTYETQPRSDAGGTRLSGPLRDESSATHALTGTEGGSPQAPQVQGAATQKRLL